MPGIFQTIAVFLASIISPMVGRVLGALGMGIVTLTGVQSGVTAIIDMVKGRMGGITADILNLLTIAGFDVFLSVVLSAWLGIISLQALWGGFKKLGFIGEQQGG